MVCVRLASREFFNQYSYASTHDEEELVVDESFDAVQKHLVNALVTGPAALSSIIYGKLQPSFLVTLRNGEFAASQVRSSGTLFTRHS